MRSLVASLFAVVCLLLWTVAAGATTPPHRDAGPLPQGQSGATWAGANLIHTTDTGTVATLTVPSVLSSSLLSSQVAVWVGVDGAAGSASLVQTGINLGPADAGGDGAWWTTCGTWAGGHGCGEQPIQATVLAGDQIRMAVIHRGDCRWRMSLTDMRSGRRAWWWGSNISYCALGPRTVEWVAEGWQPGTPWPAAAPGVFRDIWLQQANGRWAPGALRPSDELYSNLVQGIAEEHSGIPTVCAQGRALGSSVAIDFSNPC